MHPDMNSIKRSDWIEQLEVHDCGLMSLSASREGEKEGHII